MEVVIVSTDAERKEMKRALDGYMAVTEGKLSKEEYLQSYPRKVWIDTEMCSSYGELMPFLVVDNRGGECYCEDFATLDGAVLYATDVYMTPEHQEDWDYMGAVADGGDIVHRLEEDDEEAS